MPEDRSLSERVRRYGELQYRRAVGDADEMESAKSTCRIVARYYRKGDRILDAGCGAGHYLRSLRSRIDPHIDYCGVDATEHYIERARAAFPKEQRFFVADLNRLDFGDDSFDIVLCVNVIPNLPPPPTRAFRELIRVSRRLVVIRTLFSEVDYIIRELLPGPEGGLEEADGTYNNMYTERYYREVVRDADPTLSIGIVPDEGAEAFDNRGVLGPWGTRVEHGRQVCGQLILDWRFIVLCKQGGP